MDMIGIIDLRFLLISIFLHFGLIRSQRFYSDFKDQNHCTRVDLRYRQYDGTCNHQAGFGSSNTPVRRILRPHYHDTHGLEGPRAHSVLGKRYPLPSPRLVSMRLHPDRPGPDTRHTLLLMQMGQLIDHDITKAPVATENGEPIKCCKNKGRPTSSHCLPIPIPASDPWFETCMEFVRSQAARNKEGQKILPREQSNSLTSFLDASGIYGESDQMVSLLRTNNGKGALLKTRVVYGKERLPEDPSPKECLHSSNPLSYCPMAGDARANDQPGLSSIHLLFHLHHNTIVRGLAQGWLRKYEIFLHSQTSPGSRPSPRVVDFFLENTSDTIKERLFQETRKIMSAIIQKITYCDWLPLVLGRRLMQKYRLDCSQPYRYRPTLDPRISNVFLTAAFRFGHSMIPSHLWIDNEAKSLQNLFNVPDPTLFHFESIMAGLCKSNTTMPVDRFVSKSVTTSLFKTSRKSLDLVALNIQRGRDHGIPPYYNWREHFRLGNFVRFSQLGRGQVLHALQELYRHPRDLDLFTGGLLEKPVRGGVVGRTFGNIIGEQFRNLKYGDAYFFLNGEEPQGLDEVQRKAIMRVNIAQMICSISEMDTIQRNPFFKKSKSNPLVACRDLPPLDLTPWIHRL